HPQPRSRKMNTRPASFRTSMVRLFTSAALLVGAGAFADTVALSGSVGSTASISSAATAAASALDMGGQGTDIGEQIVKVADLSMNTNRATGLTLSIDSGNLTNGTGSVPFKVQTVAQSGSA